MRPPREGSCELHWPGNGAGTGIAGDGIAGAVKARTVIAGAWIAGDVMAEAVIGGAGIAGAKYAI